MQNQELKDYISSLSQLHNPPSKEVVREDLKRAGWKEYEISDALLSYKSKDIISGKEEHVVPDFFHNEVEIEHPVLKEEEVDKGSGVDTLSMGQISPGARTPLSSALPKVEKAETRPQIFNHVFEKKEDIPSKIVKSETVRPAIPNGSAFVKKPSFQPRKINPNVEPVKLPANNITEQNPKVSQSKSLRSGGGGRKKLFVLVFSIVSVLGLGGFFGHRYFTKELLVTIEPGSKEFLGLLVANVLNSNNEEITFSFEASSEPKTDAEGLEKESTTESEELKVPFLTWVSRNILDSESKVLNLKAIGDFQKINSQDLKASNFHTKLDVSVGGNKKFFEFSLKNDDLAGNFFKVKEYPLAILDIKKVKDHWIGFDSKKIIDNKKYLGVPDDFTETDAEGLRNLGDFGEAFILSLSKSGVVNMALSPALTSVNGKTLYAYDISFGSIKSSTFRVLLLEQLGKSDKTQSFVTAVQQNAFSDAVENILSKTKATVYLNNKGKLDHLDMTGIYYPMDKRWASVGIKWSLKMELGDLSSEFEPVREFSGISDVVLKINNLSNDFLNVEEQIQSVSEIKKALSLYKEFMGEYPSELGELTKTATEIVDSVPSLKVRLVDTFSGGLYKDKPFMEIIPKDLYTGNDFVYVGLGTDYGLSFQINLPKYDRSSVDLKSLYSVNYSGVSPKVTWLYVKGLNTTNSKTISLQANRESEQDFDRDGLPDSFEEYIGTNKSVSDTDANGTSDADEFIRKGFGQAKTDS